jgi:acyl carrier protein
MTALTEGTGVREHLREFVRENFLYLRPDVDLQDSDDLLGLGIVDSMGFVELVEQLQSSSGVVVADTEITEENFGSIDGMVAFVQRKRAP